MPTVSERINVLVAIRSICSLRLNRWSYYRHFSKMTKASVVLVWQDTNLEAYSLSRHLDIPVWCIQNGIRHDYSPPNGTGLLSRLRELGESTRPAVDLYFIFGEVTEQLLSPLIETEFIKIGSFRTNEYSSQRLSEAERSKPTRKDIGLIVSFPNATDIPGNTIHGNSNIFARIDGQEISFQQWFSADALLAQSLSEVAKQIGVSFSIVGKRPSHDSTERQFFSNVPGCEETEVLSHEKGFGYELADSFDYLFTIDSTLGYEMLALESQVGFVSNRFRMIGVDSSEMTFGSPLNLPIDGPIWTSAITSNAIQEFVLNFLRLENNQWLELRKNLIPRVMMLDSGNRSLRQHLTNQILGTP